ncbi:MAG TPA: hypothetical protein VF459_12240 [Caulobacteraceae bacterium]
MSDPTPPPEDERIVPNDRESISFVKGLVAAGHAARLGPDGVLPRGATHEIVGETPGGLPILVRRRFGGGMAG